MHPALREAIEAAFRAADERAAAGDAAGAFAALERAHVLGQRHTPTHLRAHYRMLRHGIARRDAREVAGQLLRLAGAALMTWAWVPEGNAGGANVSAFRSMEIADELRRLIEPPEPDRRGPKG